MTPTPDTTTPPDDQPADRANDRSLLRTLLQLGGFLLGVGMLAYCIRLALSEKNRDGLRQLAEAEPSMVAALLGVTTVGFVVSGLMFWLVLRPVIRLKPIDVVATNVVAIFLSYLPLKLSVMFRIAIHKGRDGVPLVIIGPWFGAVGLALLIPTVPIVALAAIRPSFDAIGLGIVAAITLALTWITSALAKAFGGERGLRIAQRLADKQPIGLVRTVAHSEPFKKFDESLAMLSSFRQVLLVMSLRVIDITAFAGRFYIVSRMLGQPMDFDQCVMASVVYFMIGVFSPIGSLGAREAGTAGVFGLFGTIDFDQVAVITVVVTGAEVLVSLVTAALGIAWLRPDRLLRTLAAKRREAAQPEAAA